MDISKIMEYLQKIIDFLISLLEKLPFFDDLTGIFKK